MSSHPLLLDVKQTIKNDIEEFLNHVEDPKARKLCSEWAAQSLGSLAEVLEVVDDIEDVNYVIAIRYTAMKSNWIELNTLLNYQEVTRGNADPVRMQLAGMISHVLGKVEPFVDSRALNTITQLLSDPIKTKVA